MDKRFVSLNNIPEMTEEERTYLNKKCSIHKGYYDPEADEFVIFKDC